MENSHEATRLEEVREDVIIAYQEVMNKLKVMKGGNANNNANTRANTNINIQVHANNHADTEIQHKPAENDMELHEGDVSEVETAENVQAVQTAETHEMTHEEHQAEEQYQERYINENIVELARETTDNIAKGFSELRSSFLNTLDNLKTNMLEKQEEFSILEKAVVILKEELSSLYQIKDTVHAMQVLIMAKRDKELALEKEFAEFRRNLETEKMRMDKDRMREQNEYTQKRDMIRRREQEQYETNKRKSYEEMFETRRKLDEEFEAREAALAARENEHQQMKDREAKIVAREQEYIRLRDKEARFPEELKNAVQKAETALSEQLNRKLSYDLKVAEIGWASERTLLTQKIEAIQLQLEQYRTLKDMYSDEQ